jgi:hypothetical protein
MTPKQIRARLAVLEPLLTETEGVDRQYVMSVYNDLVRQLPE